MKLNADDRRDLEDAAERLEGVHRRTSQVETRLALEAVRRVLERDDAKPTIQVDLSTPPRLCTPRSPVGPDPGRAWGGR